MVIPPCYCDSSGQTTRLLTARRIFARAKTRGNSQLPIFSPTAATALSSPQNHGRPLLPEVGPQEPGDTHHVGGEDAGAPGAAGDDARQHQGPQQEEERQVQARQRARQHRREGHREFHREGRADCVREPGHHPGDALRGG